MKGGVTRMGHIKGSTCNSMLVSFQRGGRDTLGEFQFKMRKKNEEFYEI